MSPIPIRSLKFAVRPGAEIAKLKPCAHMGEKPAWLSREDIIGSARKVLPSLPDDSQIMIVEAWDEFPLGAIAVIPPAGDKAGRNFAISVESIEVTNPVRFRKP